MTNKPENIIVKIANGKLRALRRVACRYVSCPVMLLMMLTNSCGQREIPEEDPYPVYPATDSTPIEISGSIAGNGWKGLSSRAESENRSDDRFYAEDIIGVFAFEIENYNTSQERIRSTNIMHEMPLELNTGGEWEYVGKTAYWPNTNGSFVRFLSVYPHSLYSNEQVKVSAFNSNSPTTIEIVPDGTTDIRISDLTEAYSRETIKTINGGNVPLVFRHLLQKIVVTFHSSEDSDYSGTIGYIAFKDKKWKYTYTFPGITPKTRDAGEGLSENGKWTEVDNGNDTDYIKISADVKLDNENHEMISHGIAYLPPMPDVLNNMYVIIDGIDYPVQMPSIENAQSGQAVNISVNISTVEKELVCTVTGWNTEPYDEETIY